MPLISACDLREMVDALGGVDVSIGSTTCKGLKRAPDVEMFVEGEAELIGRSVSVLIVTGDLSGLANEAVITIDGEAMKVHRYMAESNGSVTRILAKKA